MRTWKTVRAGLVSVGIFIMALFVCFVTTDVYAENYKITGQGDLQLDVPQGWTYEVDSSDKNLPPTIITGSKKANEFKMMITPLWRTDGEPLGFSSERLRELVVQESTDMLTQAVEDHVDIRDLKGKDAYGYCYGVTDKELVGKKPSPGEYRYMVRCSVVVGEVFLSATMMCQDKDDPHITKAQSMLENARQLK